MFACTFCKAIDTLPFKDKDVPSSPKGVYLNSCKYTYFSLFFPEI